MEENQIPTTPSVPNSVSFPGSVPSTPRKKGNKWIYIVIVFIVIIVVIAFLVFKGAQAPSTDNGASPSPETSQLTNNQPVATPAPTPSPSPSSVSKDQIKIQILNGTGIPGEAAYLQNQLKPLGYTNITAGNADSTTNTTTQVIFASGVSQTVMTEITTQLKSIYQTVQSDTSRSLTSTDVQITTGLRKGATPKPVDTATPTPTPATP